jgi:hypothetical protein
MLLDYGLVREHYSVFVGMMTRNRREELYTRLRIKLREQFGEDEAFGRVVVIPVGEREAKCILRFRVGNPGVAKAKRPPPETPVTDEPSPAQLLDAEES